MEATPRPWGLVEDFIQGPDGKIIGEAVKISDRDLILRAVNAHDGFVAGYGELLGRLKKVLLNVERSKDDDYAQLSFIVEQTGNELRPIIAYLESALAKAKGGA